MAAQRKVEIFSAGCAVCQDAIELVKGIACPSCDVAVLDLTPQDSACCSDVRSLAIGKKLQLEARIKALRTMSRALDEVIAMCVDDDRPLESCPILSALENGIVRRQ